MAVAAVAVVGLAGCSGGSEKAGDSPSSPASSTSSTTTPPPHLETPQDVKAALGAACAEQGGDFNQFGIEAPGTEHIACSLEPNGNTNSIVYSWSGDAMPAPLQDGLRKDVAFHQDRGDAACLIESETHKWALHIFDTQKVNVPAEVTREIGDKHAVKTAGSC